MTTFSELRDRVENAVNDPTNTFFSADLVAEWIEDAIREYSQHFPRRARQTIAAADNDRAYDLNTDVQDILSVEYPQGENPPKYLTRRPYTHPDFWEEDGYYDWFRHHDAQDAPELYISTIPSTGEDIRVTYLGDHDSSFSAGTTISVPERHEPILIKFCVWQAVKILEQAEEQAPTSNSSLLMAQLAQNAYRAERAYYDVLRRALAGQEGRSTTTRWKMDKHDRIY